MSKAEQNAITPDTMPPRVLPSILELGLLIRAINDRCDIYDQAKLAAKDHTSDERLAEKGYKLAFHREEALRELVMTLPAQSPGDVAVQLYLAFLELGFLQDHHLDREEVDGRVNKLHRLVAGMLPAAAAAAGFTVAQISSEDIARLVAFEHPALEA